jgi:predicted secreted hydrolase
MRRLILLPLLAAAIAGAQPAADAPLLPVYPEVTSGAGFAFPRDHGAHPDHRTEWWYFTGWLETADKEQLGFQITFFRSRPATDQRNPSAFAPRQILFAHAALSDPAEGALLHDQRSARAGFGIADAATADTRIRLLDWSLVRRSDGSFRASVPASDFALELGFAPTQGVLVNGDGGYSRKGPQPEQASHYFSMPHLQVNGAVFRNGRREAVTGRAWLDREWSSSLLAPGAVGWDWTGINFDDGSALMAFRMRGGDGGTVHSGGTFRSTDGRTTILRPGDVRFIPRRRWRSPATGAVYPVEAEFELRLPGGVRRVPLKPLFDAQELDGRSAGMPVYWEGAVRTPGGSGYLELTGYAAPQSM